MGNRGKSREREKKRGKEKEKGEERNGGGQIRRWPRSSSVPVVKEGRKCSGESCSSSGAAAPAFQFDGAAVTVICLERKRRKWRLLQAAVATGIWRSELLYWDEDDVAAVVDGFYAVYG
ncbi:hypothetical protein F0562_005672 [Nyssa sinensis]|uniref:Uncharacterized protein n=1 Tax=Nyssa sinensis TaxID=561372 RepID=A0A5J5APE4_9ASTE|nr:hypothetical protein F0562_005672 [Nyssa sinensis]